MKCHRHHGPTGLQKCSLWNRLSEEHVPPNKSGIVTFRQMGRQLGIDCHTLACFITSAVLHFTNTCYHVISPDGSGSWAQGFMYHRGIAVFKFQKSQVLCDEVIHSSTQAHIKTLPRSICSQYWLQYPGILENLTTYIVQQFHETYRQQNILKGNNSLFFFLGESWTVISLVANGSTE